MNESFDKSTMNESLWSTNKPSIPNRPKGDWQHPTEGRMVLESCTTCNRDIWECAGHVEFLTGTQRPTSSKKS